MRTNHNSVISVTAALLFVSTGFAADPPTGLLGQAPANSGTQTIGVKGISTANSGTGVSGSGGQYGVYGESSGTGVYGKSLTANGWGLYAEGDAGVGKDLYVYGEAHFTGPIYATDLTWDPVTSHVSLPAGAFMADTAGSTHTNKGPTLIPGTDNSIGYLAPVQLPHGATVTKFSFFWTDSSYQDGVSHLMRIDLAGNEVSIARAQSIGGHSSPTSGSTVTGSSVNTDPIEYPSIDNSKYAYYVFLALPRDEYDATVNAHGVVIEYMADRPY